MSVAYVIGAFPSLSETFILREIGALREQGVPPVVFAMERGRGAAHADAAALRDTVGYRPALCGAALWRSQLYWLRRAPRRYARCIRLMAARPGRRSLGALRRAKLVLAAAHFARLAERAGCRHVHAHFAHVTADVAAGMAALLQVGHSVSVHAWDLYAQDDADLARRLAAADFVVACTEAGRQRVLAVLPGARDRVHRIRHGIAAERCAPAEAAAPLILAVGRLVEKKGFGHLVEACRLLRAQGVPFACRIVGEGAGERALRARVGEAGLAGAVELAGALTQEDLMPLYRQAAVIVVPSVVASGGDRDGLPNVVVEAMAMGIPVVASNLPAIAEAVADGVNGVLVRPGDPAALAEGICRLLENRDLRARLGKAGRETALRDYDLGRNVSALAACFRDAIAARGPGSASFAGGACPGAAERSSP